MRTAADPSFPFPARRAAAAGWASGLTAAVLLVAGVPQVASADWSGGAQGATDAGAADGGRAAPSRSPGADAAAPGRCRHQPPQRFLMRSSYIIRGAMTAEEATRRARAHRRAVAWKVARYGQVPGLTPPAEGGRTVVSQIAQATFFGHAVHVHRRVAPALRCAEVEIRAGCARAPYQPTAVGGFRDRNTMRGGELTNHAFGIAIDIDPEKNPCCGCVDPWPDNPRCAKPAARPYDRMAMPECWVHAFERVGFYWLGHDEQLVDTMHFEFLGEPDRVAR